MLYYNYSNNQSVCFFFAFIIPKDPEKGALCHECPCEVRLTEEYKREYGDRVRDRVDTCQRLKLEAVICAGILPPGDQRRKGIGTKRPQGLQHGKAVEVRKAIKPAWIKKGGGKVGLGVEV